MRELENSIKQFPKTDVPGHKFIKTVSVGNIYGHILKKKDQYWLCLRDCDEVSLNTFDNRLFGFERSSIAELEELIYDKLTVRTKATRAGNISSTNPRRVVEPISNAAEYWIYKVKDLEMLNVKTGLVFSMCLPSQNLVNLFGLSAYSQRQIMYNGVVIRDFVLARKRIDGKLWSEIIGKPLRRVATSTIGQWSVEIKNGGLVYYRAYVIEKGSASTTIGNTDDLEKLLDIDRGNVQHYFSSGGAGFLAGWGVRLCSDVLDL
jgi:hypothetical protein